MWGIPTRDYDDDNTQFHYQSGYINDCTIETPCTCD